MCLRAVCEMVERAAREVGIYALKKYSRAAGVRIQVKNVEAIVEGGGREKLVSK